jgi:maltose/moltooligosaccharide transporter
VRYAFVFGGIVLFAAVGWTIVSTREYPPEVLASHEAAVALASRPQQPDFPTWLAALLGGVVGVLLLIVNRVAIRIWSASCTCWVRGLVLTSASVPDARLATGWTCCGICWTTSSPCQRPCANSPGCSSSRGSALFAMWIFTTAGVAAHHYGTTDTSSQAYNDAADWVGVLFAGYNGFSVLGGDLYPMAGARGRTEVQSHDQPVARCGGSVVVLLD